MFKPPADRKAKRAPAPLEPNHARQQVAATFAVLEPTQHLVAVDIVAAWPRLIHHLAREGALASPAFNANL